MRTQTLVSGLKRGHYCITNDPLIEVARIGMTGVAPRNHYLIEAVLLPFAFLLQLGFVIWMDWVVRRGAKKGSTKTKKSQ